MSHYKDITRRLMNLEVAVWQAHRHEHLWNKDTPGYSLYAGVKRVTGLPRPILKEFTRTLRNRGLLRLTACWTEDNCGEWKLAGSGWVVADNYEARIPREYLDSDPEFADFDYRGVNAAILEVLRAAVHLRGYEIEHRVNPKGGKRSREIGAFVRDLGSKGLLATREWHDPDSSSLQYKSLRLGITDKGRAWLADYERKMK